MTDHELEQRLQHLDPVPATASVDPVDGPRARALLEQIMSTPTVEAPAPTRRRWPLAAALGAAAAATIAIVAVAATRSPGGEPVSASYALQASDAMAMCLPIADAPPPPAGAVAFGGTVTDVAATSVVLDVDRTYAGDEVDTVTLATPPEVTTVALDGVEFTAGQRYLVTVVDGVVRVCGASGPATPELEAIYATWFGA